MVISMNNLKYEKIRILESLPERVQQGIKAGEAVYKTVIILQYFQGMKIKEIAAVMDIPEGSVKGYLSRAKKILRNTFE